MSKKSEGIESIVVTIQLKRSSMTPAKITGCHAHHQANRQRKERTEETNAHRNAAGMQQPRQLIASDIVGAQDVPPGERRGEYVSRAGVR